jgi:hypothetical protein
MREYGKIAPTFWTGETGKKIRKKGLIARVVACYLLTAPGSNMLGTYYLPLVVMSHEVGISIEEASKALASLSEVDFAHYDDESEYVFVLNMARYQIGERLNENDKRVTGIKNQLETLRKTPFFNQFLNRYREAFHLQDISPSEASSKPHRSQEQEQEQEQEKIAVSASPSPANGSKRKVQLSDAEFIEELRKNVAYRDIDIDAELGKIDAWLLTPNGSGKKKTRKRIFDWMNRTVDRQREVAPVSAASPSVCAEKVLNDRGRSYDPCGKPIDSQQSLPALPFCSEHLPRRLQLQTRLEHDHP